VFDQKKESDTERPESRNKEQNRNKHDDYILIPGEQDIVQDVETKELEGNKMIKNVFDAMNKTNNDGEGNEIVQNQTTNTDKQQLSSDSAHEIQSSVRIDNSTKATPSTQEFDEE
jgi:hypothetical protein